VAFSPDNHWLVTGSYDHTARLWALQVEDLFILARNFAGRTFFRARMESLFSKREVQKYRKTFAELPGPDESVTQKTN
jgi:WD40 repeat protein